MPTLKLWVNGLRHEDEQAIARRLRQIDGVFAASLNHRDACAEVDFDDDRASVEQIRACIRELGYEARLAG
jgi:copper chaperone CopZ